jgi:hypothetical protein
MTTWTNTAKNAPSLQGFVLLVGGGYNSAVGSGHDLLIGGRPATGWSNTTKNTTSFSNTSKNTTSYTNTTKN